MKRNVSTFKQWSMNEQQNDSSNPLESILTSGSMSLTEFSRITGYLFAIRLHGSADPYIEDRLIDEVLEYIENNSDVDMQILTDTIKKLVDISQVSNMISGDFYERITRNIEKRKQY
jgi:hypothetical protein